MNQSDVALLMTLIEIATKAMAAIESLKSESPEAYDYVSQHHAAALAKAKAANAL